MIKLPPGTVVFEDIDPEEIRGQVLKPVEKNPLQNQKDPLTGRIRYRGKDRSEVSLFYIIKKKRMTRAIYMQVNSTVDYIASTNLLFQFRS